MIAPLSVVARSCATPSRALGRQAIRRRRVAELALIIVAFCVAWAALAGSAVLVTQ